MCILGLVLIREIAIEGGRRGAQMRWNLPKVLPHSNRFYICMTPYNTLLKQRKKLKIKQI